MDADSVNMLQSVFKKDDDAFVTRVDGQTFVETTAPMPTVLTLHVPDPTDDYLLEHAAVAPIPDVRIQLVCNLFVVNTVVALLWLAITLPLFSWNLSRNVALVLLIVSCIVQLPLYLSMILLRHYKQPPVAVFAVFLCWIGTMGLVFGSTASLAGNVAPLQLQAMLWAQGIVVIVYTKQSSREIVARSALLYMLIGTMVVWAICIAEFVIEHDWVAGTIILILAIGCAVYSAHQIRESETRHYNSSWDDLLAATVQFYGEPVILLLQKLGL